MLLVIETTHFFRFSYIVIIIITNVLICIHHQIVSNYKPSRPPMIIDHIKLL